MLDPMVNKIMGTLERYTLPPIIILDITNVCNLRCIHCPHAEIQARGDFKPYHMPWDLFETTMDELVGHEQPCVVRIVGDGEPLIHPRLFDMIEFARTRTGCIVNLTTNGVLLNPEKADALLGLGTDLIDVSIDALTRPAYEIVRRGGDYMRLMGNMFHLIEERNRIGAHTKIMVSFIEQDENQGESGPFQAFWEPLIDRVMVRKLHSASGTVKQAESRQRNQAENQERYPCPHLWKRLTVDFLGRIKFCAHDWGAGSVLGNISESTLGEIWNGVTLKDLRDQHVQGAIAPGALCRDCTDWASSKWDWGYERLIDRVVVGKPHFIPCLPPLS